MPASVTQHQGEPASPHPIWGGSAFRARKAEGSPAAVSRHLDRLHPLQTSSKHIHFPLNFLCSWQRRGVLLGHGYSHQQLSSWVCWVLVFLTCHKEGAGNFLRCGCHCCKSMWCGCYFLSHQVWNLRVFGWDLAPVTPLELLSVYARIPFWNAEKPSLNQESSRCYYSSYSFLAPETKGFSLN